MDNEPHKSISLLRYVLYLNYLAIILLLFSYLSIYISPQDFWAFSLFGLAYPIILFTNFVFILFWLVLRKRHLYYSIIAILIGINLLGKFVQINISGSDKTEIETFKLLSFNAHNFSYNSESGVFDKKIQQATFEFIEKQNADIVCLQEFNYIGENIYASHAQLKQRLGSDNYYFESYFNPKKNKVFGMATFSKFPIINKGIFEHPETRKFGTFIDVLYQQDTIRVYNIHLESIRLSTQDYSFFTAITPTDSLHKPNTSNLLNKLKTASINRSKQVEVLKEHLANNLYPLIICGDFNEFPSSYNYHVISKGLDDAFIEKGKGIGKTFGSTAAARIDYILFDPQFNAIDYHENRINLSDHYPISTTLSYK